MEIKETVQKVMQEMVVPDLSKIREENSKILAVLEITNKRLDDVNTQLADQSRRIDETNKRIDEVRSELTKRIDQVHSDLINRLDANNARIDQFFQNSVTRDEHVKVDNRLTRLEDEVHAIRQQIAA
jgi:predicted  nucleic acid-binding Zn-ribbon protein